MRKRLEVVIDGVPYAPMPEIRKSEDKSLLAALEVRLDSDAGDNITVREYLCTLLTLLWDEKEGFNGKRPFGNSAWEYELYKPLIAAGFIPGTLDEDGYVDSFNRNQANDYIAELIHAAFYGVQNG